MKPNSIRELRPAYNGLSEQFQKRQAYRDLLRKTVLKLQSSRYGTYMVIQGLLY